MSWHSRWGWTTMSNSRSFHRIEESNNVWRHKTNNICRETPFIYLLTGPYKTKTLLKLLSTPDYTTVLAKSPLPRLYFLSLLYCHSPSCSTQMQGICKLHDPGNLMPKTYQINHEWSKSILHESARADP